MMHTAMTSDDNYAFETKCSRRQPQRYDVTPDDFAWCQVIADILILVECLLFYRARWARANNNIRLSDIMQALRDRHRLSCLKCPSPLIRCCAKAQRAGHHSLHASAEKHRALGRVEILSRDLSLRLLEMPEVYIVSLLAALSFGDARTPISFRRFDFINTLRRHWALYIELSRHYSRDFWYLYAARYFHPAMIHDAAFSLRWISMICRWDGHHMTMIYKILYKWR